ncbi:MAG: PAS domain-containing protein, partial [Myxococcota bacterium]
MSIEVGVRSSLREEPLSLHRKLVWITFFRLAVVTVLLVATAVLTLTERDALTGPVQVYLYALTIGVYLASLAYLVAMRWGPPVWLLWIAVFQVAGDVLMAGFLVWLTGGGESAFSFLFSMGIINAAILLYRPGALVAAALSALAFAILTLALQWGLIPAAADFLAPEKLRLPRLVFTLFTNAAGFVLVAVLASYVSEQERRTGRRLSATEEGLAALEALHERIVQSVASGILTLDPDGRVAFVNRAGEDLLGRAPEEMRGTPLAEVLPELERALSSASGHSPSNRGEFRASIGESPRQIGFTATPLAPAGEKQGGLVVVFQDLTALRQMEEQMRRNERLAAVGVLAAGLAHEIRNPLSSMSGSIELLKGDLPEGAEQATLMDIVVRETERLDRLLEEHEGLRTLV